MVGHSTIISSKIFSLTSFESTSGSALELTFQMACLMDMERIFSGFSGATTAAVAGGGGHGDFAVTGCTSEFGDEGGEEVRGGGAGCGELRFQRVHQGHQLLHFGHEPALFGEGWERNLCGNIA